MAREGLGFVLDIHDKSRFAVLTYGAVWGFKELGAFNAEYPALWAGTSGQQPTTSGAVGATGAGAVSVQQLDAKHMRLSNPSALLLPEYVRPHINAWMKRVGCQFQDVFVAQPLSVPVSSDEHISLLFSLCREDFGPVSPVTGVGAGAATPADVAWASHKKKLRFFLPYSYPYITSTREVFIRHRTQQAQSLAPLPTKPKAKTASTAASASAPSAPSASSTSTAPKPK